MIRDRITDTVPGVDPGLAAGAAQAIGDMLAADYIVEEREHKPATDPPALADAIMEMADGLESVRRGLCRFAGMTGEERL